MKNKKQVLAIIAIAFLVALYAVPLVLSITMPDSGWFNASIASVILIPILLFAFLLVLKAVKPSKSPIIDTIVLDSGNVLVDFAWKEHMEELGFNEKAIDYLTKNMIRHPLWNEFDRGIRPFYDIVDEFCRNNPDYEKEIRQFFEHPGDMITARPYVIPWIQNLKKAGYKVYVLSNWSDPCYEELKDSILSFEQYLDGAIWSYQHQCIKPEPEIYEKLIKIYHIDPARAVFLDDTQKNLDGAKPFGFHTILVTDHESALEGLRALGVK